MIKLKRALNLSLYDWKNPVNGKFKEREVGLEDKGSLVEINRFILKDYVDDILKRFCTPDEEKFLRAIFFKVHGESQLAREFNCTQQCINAEKHRILSKIRGAMSK